MKKTGWKGYERLDFLLNGREAIMITPKTAVSGNPWIWRAEFFDAFAEVDMAMLEKGWHLLYYKVSDMYGCPESIRLMRGFQEFVEERFGLAKKAVIFGFSRGGLYAFNYAVAYPDKVRALYLDAPVLDISSWPGGKGMGIGSADEWKECMKIYALTEETAKDFKDNPLDKIHIAAEYSIPIIIVAGDADTIVPFKENAGILADRYKKAGGAIEVILKPGVGHHPHSLPNPAPVVDFLENRSHHGK